MWNLCKIFFRSFDVSGRIQGGSFLKKKNKTVVLVCEFIIPDIVHIASSMKIDLFLWDSALSSCHRDSVIVQSASPTRVRNHFFRDLSAVCQDAALTTCCLNCSKLSVESLRAKRWSGVSNRVRQCWKIILEMRFVVAQSGSVGEQNAEKKGRKRVRQRDTLPYSCAWGADGLLSMSSLFSLSGLPSIQPLHRHSGWVSQQGYSVCLCVCVCECVHAGRWVPFVSV